MQTAYGNCIIYFENVDADVCDSPTVCVVLLAPREPGQFIFIQFIFIQLFSIQFIFSFLWHIKPVLIGSK